MEKEILEKNKQWLKKLYLEWIEYFDTWNLSDYDENVSSFSKKRSKLKILNFRSFYHD